MERLVYSLEEFEQAKNYWLNKFEDGLPEARLRPDFQDNKGDFKKEIYVSFDDELTELILKTSKNNDMLLYIVFLSGLMILINKYTNSDMVTIGSPVIINSQSVKDEIEKMYSINKFVALSEQINMNMTYKDLLIRVKRTVIEGYENQHYPLEEINKLLKVSSEDISALKNIFILKNIHGDLVLNDINNLKNDITFFVSQKLNKLEGKIIYNSEIFKEESIKTLIQSYSNILKQVLKNINIKLEQVDLVNENDKVQILSNIKKQTKDYKYQRCIHDEFEEQVERFSGKEAVVSYIDNEDKLYNRFETINYGTLNKKANQLARFLVNKGIGQEDVVGIMLEQSVESVVAIIGILKSGAVYLPIDIEYPKDRIKYMLDDSKAKLLITQKEFLDFIDSNIALDINDSSIYTLDNSNLNLEISPSSLANIIYTSGTAGMPKGVMIEHQSLVNYALWRIQSFGFNSDDVTLQLISMSFDGFGANLYSSLLSGGCLVLLTSECRKDARCIRNIIKNKKVTNTSVVPSIYEAIIEDSKKEDLQTMRFVVLAGEKMNPNVISISRKLNQNLKLINEYGPTECTIAALACCGVDELNYLNIGNPVENMQIYILNESNNLMPDDVFGEICITGVGLSRGYINNQALTNEKFKQNPFSTEGKIYRTGDIGKRLGNGSIEYLGRIDEQVKIRGFRVELGEIERCILKNESIKQAVVIDFEDKNRGKFLCAYFVAGREVEVSEIKEQIKKYLPSYMIPSHFIQLDQIPRTIRGKIDRKRLPNPESKEKLSNKRERPANEIENKIVAVWEEVLNRSDFGVNDNFFDLGGNSILLMKVHSKIERFASNHLKITDLFNNPTISKLSMFIESIEKGCNNNISLMPVNLPEDFFCKECNSQNNTTLTFNLEEVHFNGLKKVAKRQELDEYIILFGLYMFLLSKISENKKNSVYTFEQSGSLFPIELDFSTMTDFSMLFNNIKNILQRGPGNKQMKPADINQTHRWIDNATATIFFGYYNFNFANSDVLKIFDINILCRIENDEICFTCEYNSKKLLRQKIQDLINNYIELIEQFIEKF